MLETVAKELSRNNQPGADYYAGLMQQMAPQMAICGQYVPPGNP